MNAPQFLTIKLNKRKAEDIYRELPKSNNLMDFASNDYLGLARSKELSAKIKASFIEVFKPAGATGSRLLTGNSVLAEELESMLAATFNAQASLLFNSGYTATLSLLSSVPQKGDTILYDEYAHACIKDGARLSLAKRYAFKHNDLNDLLLKIHKSRGNLFVVAESIYSMDGDECPLMDLVELAHTKNFYLIVDEAHATGLGVNGGGLSNTLQVEDQIFARIYTFGKAVGVHGACIAGNSKLIEYLVNFARPFIYTTAMSPHSLVSIKTALQFILDNQDLVGHLNRNIKLFKEGVDHAGHQGSSSAIQPVIIPGNKPVKKAAEKLQQMGFDVRPIVSPTVKAGRERLRICLHAFNQKNEILSLAEEINSVSQ